MIFRTHVVFGFLLGLIVYDYLNLGQWWWFFPLVLIGAGFPDIDTSKSKFGKKLGVISKLIEVFVKHRGIFHSLFFGGILGWLLWQAFGKTIGLGFFVGFVSHLLGDGLTVQGINFIYPFKQLSLKGFIKTGGGLEKIIFYVLSVIDIFLVVKLLNIGVL